MGRRRGTPPPDGASSDPLGPGDARRAVALVKQFNDTLPLFIGAILVASVLLLMVVFRSVTVPLKAAVMNLLFRLSMDDEVFLVTRIHEAYRRTGDNAESVARGLATTGRVITCSSWWLAAWLNRLLPHLDLEGTAARPRRSGSGCPCRPAEEARPCVLDGGGGGEI